LWPCSLARELYSRSTTDGEGNKPKRASCRITHPTGCSPFGRFGEKTELHGAVIFLISDAVSGFVTGVIIPIDGGYLTNNI
jgi:NAD(P)-dependent dehydrogenase (short-subunit alcohol dehydrogenase family)